MRARAQRARRTRSTAALEARKAALADAALDARLAGERIDVTLPVRPRSAGPHPSDQPDDRRGRGDLRRDGLRLSPRVPTSRTTGTTSPRSTSRPSIRRARRWTPSICRGERDGRRLVLRTHTSPVQVRTMLQTAAADPHHRAGPHLPLRLRCDALADVPSGRGPGDRRGDPHGSPEGLPDRFPARLLRRRRSAGALPPVSYFPFTEPSAEVDIGCARDGRIADASATAATGWRSSAAAWSTRRCSPTAASIPTAIRASPSAWGWSGSPC